MSTGRVISATRRQVKVALSESIILDAGLRGNVDEVVVGDLVELEQISSEYLISKNPVRKNVLSRSYGEKQKLLASNLDALFIVSAVKPAINTIFIDRVISSAEYEGIKTSLIYHKIDLEEGKDGAVLNAYSSIGYKILKTTLRAEDGLLPLKEILSNPIIEVAALCGISGVGKSSIINALVPEALQETGKLSDKIDQGKQTTSMGSAHRIQRDSNTLYLIDLPGLQNYGITQIPLEALSSTFKEFAALTQRCRFSDCSHISEPNCAILAALSAGDIAKFRYDSYLQMREEIISAKPY